MTVLEIDDDYVKYMKHIEGHNIVRKGYISYIIVFICVGLSSIVLFLEVFEWTPLNELQKTKRIKDNVRSWVKLITDKTEIESTKGKLASTGHPALFDFLCYDFGSYYSAVRLDDNTYLPEFIQRGNGDVWKFAKAAQIDESAKQFCKYNIYKGDSTTLTCGLEMFDSAGYSGYFELDHPCQLALDIMKNNGSETYIITKKKKTVQTTARNSLFF